MNIYAPDSKQPQELLPNLTHTRPYNNKGTYNLNCGAHTCPQISIQKPPTHACKIPNNNKYTFSFNAEGIWQENFNPERKWRRRRTKGTLLFEARSSER